MIVKLWMCPKCGHVVDDFDNRNGLKGDCYGQTVGLLGKVADDKPHPRAKRVFREVEIH